MPRRTLDPVDQSRMLRALTLLGRFTNMITAQSRAALGEIEVSNAQVRLLVLVARHPSANPSELARMDGVSPSALSRALRRLVDAGLINRRADRGDLRRIRLQLTARGRRSVERFEDELVAFFVESRELVEELVSLCGGAVLDTSVESDLPPLRVADGLGEFGAKVVADLLVIDDKFGIAGPNDRFALWEVGAAGESQPGQLAEVLGLSTGGMTGVLDRLEEAKLIVRSRPSRAGDRRAVLLTLAPSGAAAARAYAMVLSQHRSAAVEAFAQTQARFVVSSVA